MAIAIAILTGVALLQLGLNLFLFSYNKLLREELEDRTTTRSPIDTAVWDEIKGEENDR